MAYLKPQSPLRHNESGNYIYPLTTIDQVIMDDNNDTVIIENYEIPYTLLESEWVKKNNKYLQIIDINGLTDSYNTSAKLIYTDDYETNLKIKKYSKRISYAKQEDGRIIFYCLEKKPIVDIPIEVEVYV